MAEVKILRDAKARIIIQEGLRCWGVLYCSEVEHLSHGGGCRGSCTFQWLDCQGDACRSRVRRDASFLAPIYSMAHLPGPLPLAFHLFPPYKYWGLLSLAHFALAIYFEEISSEASEVFLVTRLRKFLFLLFCRLLSR